MIDNVILYKDDDIEICLSPTSMKVSVENARERYLLTSKLSGQKQTVLDTLNAQAQKIYSTTLLSRHLKKQDYLPTVSCVNRKRTTPIDFITGIIGYVKGVGRKT